LAVQVKRINAKTEEALAEEKSDWIRLFAREQNHAQLSFLAAGRVRRPAKPGVTNAVDALPVATADSAWPLSIPDC
jgi:hypothetical protein